MRPVHLELEGFTAFRDRTIVDLDGVDLFALCGPTGAGKTSIVDALTFALYGRVPRLDERTVAPVISQNGLEARVRLDFTVGDAAYVAVRVVRATKAGASTKEARLETAAGELLAGDAKSMTTAVVNLVGLDFGQFTTCVSLPQGEFARFLHTEPRYRQDLLVRLLDLGLYGRVASVARQRQQLAADRAAVGRGRLEALAYATEEALALAATRVAELEALRDVVDAAEPRLEQLRADAGVADSAAEAAATAVAMLGSVAVPQGVGAVAAEVAASATARAAAIDAVGAAEEAVKKADAALEALPPRTELDAHARDHADSEGLAARAAKGREVVATSQRAATAAAEALEQARAAAESADAVHHAARTSHLAHSLAAEVVVGQPCPVCRQTVTEPPAPAPADVAAAKRVHDAARKRLDEATEQARVAEKEQARFEEKLGGIEEQLAAVAARLEAAPSSADVAAALAEVGIAEERARAAHAAAGAARDERAAADARVDAAAKAAESARRAFDAARDRVAGLGAPAPDRTDLVADWEALVAWADERRPALLAEADAQRGHAEQARAALGSQIDAIAAECRARSVEPGDRPRDAVGEALGRAKGEVQRITDGLAEAAGVRKASAVALDEAAVAGSLANHLRADGFERWILEEALRELVGGATTVLRDLSGGAYSLTLDERSRAFAVVDHVNADAVRSARTLSGGETFLASLALALALADQVAGSGSGAARLETILLDEGFGSLDADTLDVVAAALEELGARGRMVGVVTHVRELAERLPVRFELRKVGGASTIERIDS